MLQVTKKTNTNHKQIYLIAQFILGITAGWLINIFSCVFSFVILVFKIILSLNKSNELNVY